jgi:cytochrome b pre-mRNA-processing protein 3
LPIATARLRLNMRMQANGQAPETINRKQNAVKLLKKLFGQPDDRAAMRPLYESIIAQARQPDWYQAGAVADTIDGRFDMMNAVLALVLIRMEALGEPAQDPSVRLTEMFVEDMDGQLRELGIGDIVVGKHIGKMMSALGGRLGAYRVALAGDAPLAPVLERNLYRGAPVAAEALAFVEGKLLALRAQLSGASLDTLMAGKLAA